MLTDTIPRELTRKLLDALESDADIQMRRDAFNELRDCAFPIEPAASPAAAPPSKVDQAVQQITVAIQTPVHSEAIQDGDHFSHQLAVPDAASPAGGRPTPAPDHGLTKHTVRALWTTGADDDYAVYLASEVDALIAILRADVDALLNALQTPRAQMVADSAVFPRVERRTSDRPRDPTSSSSSSLSEAVRVLAAELHFIVQRLIRIGHYESPDAMVDLGDRCAREISAVADRLDALAAPEVSPNADTP